MANQTLIDKTATTALSSGDLIYVLRDPGGTPVDRKMDVDDLFASAITLAPTGTVDLSGASSVNLGSPTATDIEADSISFDGGTTQQTVFLKGSLVFNAGTVAANSVTTTTTTITGALTTGQTVAVNCNAPIANLKYTAQITAANTVTLYIWNDTLLGIGGGNRTYSFTIIG